MCGDRVKGDFTIWERGAWKPQQIFNEQVNEPTWCMGSKEILLMSNCYHLLRPKCGTPNSVKYCAEHYNAWPYLM